jgi:hypothetical protein
MDLEIRLRVASGRGCGRGRTGGIVKHPISLLVAAVLLGGCNFAPHYDRPKSEEAGAYKEAAPNADPAAQGWKLAEPKDAALRNQWWEVYGDPKLNELEERVAISNQTIIAAEANYRAAHALVLQAQAALFPTLSLNPAVTREKSSAALAGIGGGVSTGATTTTGGTTTGGSTATGSTTTTAASAARGVLPSRSLGQYPQQRGGEPLLRAGERGAIGERPVEHPEHARTRLLSVARRG